MTMTLNERKELAMALRARGYNCSQTVALAMQDILPEGITANAIERLSAGLGGGIGGCRMACGCVTTMALLEGALKYDNPKAKAPLYKGVATMVNEFVDREGSAECSVLKGTLGRDCNTLILDSIEILHNRLSQ